MVPRLTGSGAAGASAVPDDAPVASTSASSVASVKELSHLSYILYYLLLFFAYWFGASRFDVDGDGDFDPEDMEAFLQNMSILGRNFADPKVKRKLAPGAKEVQQNVQPPVASQEAPPVDGSGWDGVADRIEERITQISKDVMSSNVVKVDGITEERKVLEKLKQRFPKFCIGQCVICFLLWVVFDLKKTFEEDKGNFFTHEAGLDSLFGSGWSDLQIAGTNCEDYRAEVWRYLTYQFTHVGIMHVFMNCVLLLLLGVPLEGLHGFRRMFLMFNVGVLGGACCFFVADPHFAVVGMSGGCYSLVGLHVADLIMNWGQKKFRKPTIALLVFIIATEVVAYELSLGSANASHTVHFGGVVAGIMIGILVGKNLKVLKSERILQGVVLAISFGLVVFCFAWLFSNEAPRHIWEDEAWCWKRQAYNANKYGNRWVCVRCSSSDCVSSFTADYQIRTVAENECSGGFEGAA
mmetsp:Transcript_88041/g.188928  ORF Transcript_88041/g.188928 Transcript_88041/m.188928 type:complete len:466 (+) Transcript_88041:79-1476(+)|eukprot:CAMPEP_0180602174 /NCGR_PEP_ID=MMETSP1037_2-20121125/24841_1 /TAXON_ID=632150 /ORGANISM="Azadinium spinosum, Strain 3D9" /LENGTH=465 /DNA_ID=CAMNT_0022620999 /DNA_START=36 /DNA_END=1433 /DNA_ORIENTATION=+